MSVTTVQDNLFRYLKNRLPGETSLPDIISEVLHISTDSAYRRIRGETPLVLDELLAICHHFNLSMDQVLESRTDMVLFKNTRVHNQQFTYQQYLDRLKKQLVLLEQQPEKQVIYMSKDLPVFYNFYFRPLIAFRYFFWMKIHLSHPGFEDKQFDIELLPPPVEQISRELIQVYNQLPSTEIWNVESINSTISQIEFSRASGHFANLSDVRTVYDALEDSIRHIQEQVEQGCKYLPGEEPGAVPQSLRFFTNRVLLGDNTILAITGNVKTAYINYGHLNYLETNDTNFCDALKDDFENLMRRCTLLSGTGERQRNIFFNILLSKIKDRKQAIA